MATQLRYWRPDPRRPPQAELERQQLLLQRPTVAAQHHPGADRDDADLGFGRRRSRGLPLPHDIGQEPRAGRAGLGELLVGAVAVVPDCRARHEHLGRTAQLGESSGQGSSAVDAAVANGRLVLGGPAVVADTGTREIDDGVVAFQPGWVVDGPGFRIPANLVLAGRAPDQPGDGVPVRLQRHREGGADQPVRAGEDNPHLVVTPTCCRRRPDTVR